MSALRGIGIGLSVAASIWNGIEQNKLANENAEEMKRQAEFDKFKTKLELDRHWDNIKRIKGARTVAYSSAGVDLTSGSVIAALEDVQKEAELDAFIIQMGGSERVRQAASAASSYKKQGEMALITGGLRAAGDVAMYYGRDNG